jgi:hypothetical protein
MKKLLAIALLLGGCVQDIGPAHIAQAQQICAAWGGAERVISNTPGGAMLAICNNGARVVFDPR